MAVRRQPMKPGESNVAGTQAAVARANEALALLRADRAHVGDLVRLVHNDDWLVATRAVDPMEKLGYELPESVQPHRGLFIGRLAQHPSWEIRLQIARGAGQLGAARRA